MTTKTQDVVRARRIEIVDSKGQPRVVLEASTDGSPRVQLLNENGVAQLVLLDADGTGGVALLDENGHILLSIAKTGLMIWDSAGHERLNLYTGPSGLGARFSGEDGEVIGAIALAVSGDQLVVASAGPDGKFKSGTPKFAGDWSKALKDVELISRALNELLKLAERFRF